MAVLNGINRELRQAIYFKLSFNTEQSNVTVTVTQASESGESSTSTSSTKRDVLNRVDANGKLSEMKSRYTSSSTVATTLVLTCPSQAVRLSHSTHASWCD